jgi:hypothetical protein
MGDEVQIPGLAIGRTPEDVDLLAPAAELLRGLSLLPTHADIEKNNRKNPFATTPDSVAVIEAGATTASKWWAASIAAGSTGITAGIVRVWEEIGKTSDWNQPVAIFAVGLVIAAGTIGIVSLLGSDIRGRAAATVATIEARQQVACVFIQEAQRSYQNAETEPLVAQSISLPGIAEVKNRGESGDDELGWKAIAAREQDGKIDYLLVKGKQTAWTEAGDVDFS